MNTDDLIQKEIEEFNKKWSRIEKTMTGHISGRKIWDADTQGHDDEANYLYVDETLERHFKKSLHKIKDKAKREAIEKVEKIIQGIYTEETENGYHEDIELNRAHNGSLDILMTRLDSLKEDGKK